MQNIKTISEIKDIKEKRITFGLFSFVFISVTTFIFGSAFILALDMFNLKGISTFITIYFIFISGLLVAYDSYGNKINNLCDSSIQESKKLRQELANKIFS